MKDILKTALVKVLNDPLNTLPQKGSTVYLGISGGVDSAVSAWILKELGYDVRGVFLICWNPDAPGCTAKADQKDAIKVAGALNIPLEVKDYRKEYEDLVFSSFVKEYQKGGVPNPDVLCNTFIKFGVVYDFFISSRKESAVLTQNGNTKGRYIATGHYARRVYQNGWQLIEASDQSKDQSYFIYQISGERLSRVCFPLGSLLKPEVRKVANEVLPFLADRSDSQGICFIGDVRVRDFIKTYIKPHSGDVISISGEVIGKHDGAEFYSIGQRHGFQVQSYDSSARYVIAKYPEKNQIVVGPKDMAYRDSFIITSDTVVWRKDPFHAERLTVRIRNLGEKIPCTLQKKQKDLVCELSEPIFGVSAAQHAVFSTDSVVCGGGQIGY